MILPIIYPSAAYYWREKTGLNKIVNQLSDQNKRRTLPVQYHLAAREIISFYLQNEKHMKNPLAILSPDDTSRIQSQQVRSFVRPAFLPEQSFVELNRYQNTANAETVFVVIASPELCFLQAAQVLSVLDLIEFGYELCSDYFYDEDKRYGLSYSGPVTTPGKIRELLNQSFGLRGLVNARRAAQYLQGHARSPMEILLSMIMNLPISYGGFAIKGFHLNGRAELSTDGKKILGWNSCHCDMIWEDEKIALEYDSDQVHLDTVQHARDKSRFSALGASGYKVYTLTTMDMRSLDRLEHILFALRKDLHLRKEKEQFRKFRKKREELLSWIRSHMRYETN